MSNLVYRGDFVKLYHIDRKNSLKVGDEINLTKIDVRAENDEEKILLQSKLDKEFKNGVSSHGAYYYAGGVPWFDSQEVFNLKEQLGQLNPNDQFRLKELLMKKEQLDHYLISSDIELIFELVRRVNYSECISRFESFFATDFDGMLSMYETISSNGSNVKIYEVECENYERHDMSLLKRGSNLQIDGSADLYWSGKSSEKPLYEYLLKPPVRIIRQVNINEFLG